RRQSAAIERELSAIRRGVREGRGRLAEIEARSVIVAEQLDRADGVITAAAEELSGLEAELGSLRREEQLIADRAAAVAASAGIARDQLAGLPAAGADPAPLPLAAEPPVHLRVEVE